MNTSASPLFQVFQQGDVQVVEFLQENLDPVSVEEIKAQMPGALTMVGPAAPGASKVVLDLAKVRYVPSRMLGVLMETNQWLTAKGGQMRICGLQPMILEVFKFMRLDSILHVSTTRDEAVKSFRV